MGELAKIGLMGGTFNPIHHGHLINAQFLREEFGLDCVYFVPSKKPVHKKQEGDASSDDRCRMVEIAVGGEMGLVLSRAEVDRETPSYTITTVEELAAAHPGWDISLIIGHDSYLEFDTWKEFERLGRLVTVIVMNRPMGNAGGTRVAPGIPGCRFSTNPLIDISSTLIRSRVRQGKTVRYMLPEGVIDYIGKRGLYRS